MQQPPTSRNSLIFNRPGSGGLGIASLGLALLLYWRVLTLPLYHDDLVLMRLVTGVSFRDIFFSGQIYQYYRPLYDSIWKLAFLIWGFDLSTPLHGLFLLLHALNGWLVGLLAGYLYPARRGTSWLAMAIYVAFPFSYQAVPWASATGHLIVAGSIVAAVIGLERWWAWSRGSDLALLWIGTLLATFTHEAGIISGLIVAGWLAFKLLGGSPARLLRNWRRIALALVPVIAINALYVAIWVSLPKDKQVFKLFVEDLLLNFLFFGQGLTYPVAQFGGLLVGAGLDSILAAVIVVLGGLGILIAVFLLDRQGQGWIGLGWFVIGVLPSALFLSWWGYVIDGHRLLVTASIGAALAWAGAVDVLWRRLRGAWRVMPGLLAALLLIGGGGYVIRQMGLHAVLAPLYRQLHQIGREQESLAVYNLPGWIAYKARVYPLGNDGINYTTEYYPLSLLIWANTGHEPETGTFVRHDLGQDHPLYWFGLLGDEEPDRDARLDLLHRAGAVLSARVVQGRWQWEVGEPVDESALSRPVRFANGVRLDAGADLSADGRVVTLRLAWEVPGPLEEVAFVHLLCGEQIIAQADGPPLRGLYPFGEWLPGQPWQETRLIEVPDGTNPSCLQVRLGLYHPASGVRVLLQDGNEFVTIPVQGAGRPR